MSGRRMRDFGAPRAFTQGEAANALFLDELGLDLGDFGHEFLDLEFERSDVPRILLLVLGVGEGEGFYILFEFEVGLVELVALAAELYHLFD